MKHRTTDPACAEFAGAGSEWRLFGLSIRSPRRVRFDYMRGASCSVCRPVLYRTRERAAEILGVGRCSWNIPLAMTAPDHVDRVSFESLPVVQSVGVSSEELTKILERAFERPNFRSVL